MRWKCLIWLAAATALAAARANLAFTLTPAALSGASTNEVVFAAALTNTSAVSNLYLNGIQVTFTGAATNYLGADTNIFFGNVPGILPTNGSYRDVVFGVTINPAIPPGDYPATVTLAGGSNIFAADNLAAQTCQILLQPAALSLAAAGTNLVLSWPSPPGSFTLQQCADLAATNWVTVTNPPESGNGSNWLFVTPSAPGNQFYQLVYPAGN